MIHTDEDDEFDRIAHEAKLKGQPYYFEPHPTDPDKVIFRKPLRDFDWEADAIKAAVLIEREACARLCDEHAKVYASLDQNPTTKSAWAACIDNRDAIRARGNT